MALNGGLYCSLFGRSREGLYGSLFGRPQIGLFRSMFSNYGAPSFSTSADSRLGDTTPFYQQAYMGIPLWIYLIFVLGIFLSRKK